jgi:hypothetical protein
LEIPTGIGDNRLDEKLLEDEVLDRAEGLQVCRVVGTVFARPEGVVASRPVEPRSEQQVFEEMEVGKAANVEVPETSHTRPGEVVGVDRAATLVDEDLRASGKARAKLGIGCENKLNPSSVPLAGPLVLVGRLAHGSAAGV